MSCRLGFGLGYWRRWIAMAGAIVAATPLWLVAAMAQTAQAPERAEFEVLSVKQALFPSQAYFDGYTARGTCNKGGTNISGNRVELPAVSLCGLIRIAYNVQDYQIEGLPKDLTKTEQANFFALAGRAAGDAVLTDEQLRHILQTMLASRFGLKFHHETRELPVFELTIAKNGPKVSANPPAACGKMASGKSQFVFGPGQRGMTDCAGNTTMAMLADRLSFDAERPVLDKTGLAGKYAIDLHWAPEQAANMDANLPTLFTAMQEQLGLKLEPRKAPVDALIVDHAERPSDN